MRTRTLQLGHSPDPDDAFMFYALANDCLPTGPWVFQHVLQDIQILNERALRGELEITAISYHAYPLVADKYVLTSCGSSMGEGYGPLVVARQPLTSEDLVGKTIAVPGTMTTAFLVLNLLLGPGRFDHHLVPFDEILDYTAAGQADAGLIIHEGQLTYQQHQLYPVVDLGKWWFKQTNLPLPLGGNCIRRDLGEPAISQIARLLRASIEYSLAHRDQALAYALQYARDLDPQLADRFVGLYVNRWTVDCGLTGRQAIHELLDRAHQAGLLPKIETVDFVEATVERNHP